VHHSACQKREICHSKAIPCILATKTYQSEVSQTIYYIVVWLYMIWLTSNFTYIWYTIHKGRDLGLLIWIYVLIWLSWNTTLTWYMEIAFSWKGHGPRGWHTLWGIYDFICYWVELASSTCIWYVMVCWHNMWEINILLTMYWYKWYPKVFVATNMGYETWVGHAFNTMGHGL